MFFDSLRADADTEELLAAFRRTVPAGPEVLFAAKRFARVFVRRAELDGFERLLAEVRPKYLDGTDERRAAFEAWAGRFYKELHAPDACLALVGDRARDWESGLDTGLRVALWTERSNTLRQQERSGEALAIAEQAQALLSPGDPDYRVLGTNVAILRRECGRPDEAARLLENLLRDAPEAEWLPILESLATTLTELGRHTAALERAEELAELAARRGDDRTAVWASVSRVQSLIALGRVAEAAAVTDGVSVEPAHDPALAPELRQLLQQLVEPLVALDEAGVDEGVPVLEAVDEGRRGESGAAVAEVLEPVLLQDDEVGSGVGGEGLDDQLVGDHVVERAVDASLHVVAGHRDAVGAAGPTVEVVEPDREALGPVPPDEQLGVDVGPEDLRRRGVELPDDVHHRQLLVDDDLGFVHLASPSVSSGSVASRASRRW